MSPYSILGIIVGTIVSSMLAAVGLASVFSASGNTYHILSAVFTAMFIYVQYFMHKQFDIVNLEMQKINFEKLKKRKVMMTVSALTIFLTLSGYVGLTVNANYKKHLEDSVSELIVSRFSLFAVAASREASVNLIFTKEELALEYSNNSTSYANYTKMLKNEYSKILEDDNLSLYDIFESSFKTIYDAGRELIVAKDIYQRREYYDKLLEDSYSSYNLMINYLKSNYLKGEIDNVTKLSRSFLQTEDLTWEEREFIAQKHDFIETKNNVLKRLLDDLKVDSADILEHKEYRKFSVVGSIFILSFENALCFFLSLCLSTAWIILSYLDPSRELTEQE